MCETNKFAAKCQVCGEPVPPGKAVFGVKVGGEWSWLCGPCRAAAPGHEPWKIIEAYLYQFDDSAGGPDDERDHEDFRIGDYLVADGRIAEYAGPFGQVVTKETLAADHAVGRADV